MAFMILAGGSRCLHAQQACTAPVVPSGGHASNIFNEQQEAYLGDAMAEHLQRNFRVSTDEPLTAYLRQIADRLLKHMPPAQLHLQFFLVDLSIANAFNLPGGRIYVSPKIIALARNEDELAGVLAHELGHLVTHQSAIEMTRTMGQVLHVTQVTDRRDIFDKYHQLIENAWRKPGALRRPPKEREEDERIADLEALYAVGGAGYSVEAFADMFDRTAATEMKTGNWLSDLFGATKPESLRLRAMIKASAAIPEACIDRAPKASGDHFQTWQAAVIEFSGWSSQEVLHGVLNKTQLNPPLRGEIRYLKFSRDGKYVLAQDEGNIYVLTRQPFAPLFQIDAPSAAPAQFSPDSDQVVFHNHSLRVETWNIATRKRTSAHELNERNGCRQEVLSPDGKIFSCLEFKSATFHHGPDLVLFDVSSGEEVLRKTISNPNWDRLSSDEIPFALQTLNLGVGFDRSYSYTGFTPDAHYFLFGNEGASLLFDLRTHQIVSIPRPLSRQLTGRFAFLGTDRLVALNVNNASKSRVLAFPSGDLLSEVELSNRVDIIGATRGDFLILRPVKEYPVGALDLAGGKHSFAYKRSALDIFDQVFVCEERDGELGLREIGTGQLLTRTSLPGGHLGALRAAALSPDGKWLAVSEEGRGAVWDLGSGNRLYHVRGFTGAYFPNDYVFYADFPKYNDTPRGISEMSLTHQQMKDLSPLEEKRARQYGEFLVVTKIPEKGRYGGDVTLETRDVRTSATLWSREFAKEEPFFAVDSREERMVLWWPASVTQARDEMQNFPAVNEKLSGRKEQADAYFLEFLDARTGKPLGALGVETGKNRYMGFTLNPNLAPRTSGDWVTISGGANHVVVYSLSSGNELGGYFGHDAVLSAASGLLCLENESGHLTLYDLNSGQDLDRWVFSSPISLREFSPDGKRLLVLTADQNTYLLDVSPFAHANVASAPAP
jgi:WD40 repeat protein